MSVSVFCLCKSVWLLLDDVIALFRFMRSRRPAVLVPILPLSFIMGYQLDMAFGNKMERIVGEWNVVMLSPVLHFVLHWLNFSINYTSDDLQQKSCWIPSYTAFKAYSIIWDKSICTWHPSFSMLVLLVRPYQITCMDFLAYKSDLAGWKMLISAVVGCLVVHDARL